MSERVVNYISQKELEERIQELAEKISADYAGRTVHMVGILKGSVMFMCELAKRMTIPVTMDFMKCSSYGNGTVSKGLVRITKDLDDPVEGKDVLIVEDIIDSGYTLSYLVEQMKIRKPASMKICTLLDKPSRRVRAEVVVDYECFKVPDEFVVGFGLDYAQKYRNLPYIGIVKFDEEN